MTPQRTRLKALCLSALLTALLIICSMLSIPLGAERITLQLAAVLLIGGLLPTGYALLSLGAYLLLGAMGLPVFASFSGGFGVLLGATGGFLWGFIPAGLLFGLLYKRKKTFKNAFLSGILPLLICYLCGCLQYLFFLPKEGGLFALVLFILPCLLPDALKLLLVATVLPPLSKALSKGGFTADAE
ncbi:MAG: biotin transporter BioY [Clostridia bacterium]|nr:biotin transporter BioY [Clostridia bacterium]